MSRNRSGKGDASRTELGSVEIDRLAGLPSIPHIRIVIPYGERCRSAHDKAEET
jgi:hypothetical protein